MEIAGNRTRPASLNHFAAMHPYTNQSLAVSPAVPHAPKAYSPRTHRAVLLFVLRTVGSRTPRQRNNHACVGYRIVRCGYHSVHSCRLSPDRRQVIMKKYSATYLRGSSSRLCFFANLPFLLRSCVLISLAVSHPVGTASALAILPLLSTSVPPHLVRARNRS